jgi:hypothetical protein
MEDYKPKNLIVVIEEDEQPYVHEVPDFELETLQNIVGGLVQLISLEGQGLLFINEEAGLLGRPENVVVPGMGPVCGTCFIAKDDQGWASSLSDLEAFHWASTASRWVKRHTAPVPDRSLGDFSECPICHDTECCCSDFITHLYV